MRNQTQPSIHHMIFPAQLIWNSADSILPEPLVSLLTVPASRAPSIDYWRAELTMRVHPNVLPGKERFLASLNSLFRR